MEKLVCRFRDDIRGVAAIEFAMLAIPFFFIIFATLETGVAFIGEMTLDHAVDRMGRSVRTGEVAQSKMSQATFRQKLCDQVGFILDCTQLKIDLRSYASYADLPSGPPLKGSGESQELDASKFSYSYGKADTIMALQVYYEWPSLVDGLRKYYSSVKSNYYLIGSTNAFRTEPFS